MATKKDAAKTATPATASGIVIPPHSPAVLAVIAATTAQPPATDEVALGADAVLQGAVAAAALGQEPELPPPPPDSDRPIPAQDQEPKPAAVVVDPAASNAPIAPIHDLADARALPDVTDGVYQAPVYIVDSPLAIRAFKDHDGRSMAVVWTGTTLAKAAITD